MPVMIGMFQKSANLATGSNAKAHAGPMKAITFCLNFMSAANPGDMLPEQNL
jgi:hypothetical protein